MNTFRPNYATYKALIFALTNHKRSSAFLIAISVAFPSGLGLSLGYLKRLMILHIT